MCTGRCGRVKGSRTLGRSLLQCPIAITPVAIWLYGLMDPRKQRGVGLQSDFPRGFTTLPFCSGTRCPGLSRSRPRHPGHETLMNWERVVCAGVGLGSEPFRRRDKGLRESFSTSTSHLHSLLSPTLYPSVVTTLSPATRPLFVTGPIALSGGFCDEDSRRHPGGVAS